MKFSNPVGQISPGYSSPIQAYSQVATFASLINASPQRYNVLPQNPIAPGTGYALSSMQGTAQPGGTADFMYLESSVDAINFHTIFVGLFQHDVPTYWTWISPDKPVQLSAGAGLWVRMGVAGSVCVNVVFNYGTPPY